MNSRGQPQTDRKPFCCGLDFVGRQRGRAKPASCLSSFWMRINHDHSCRIMQILAGAGEGEGMDKGRAKDISAFPSCSPCCPLWRSWFLPFFFLIVNLSCTLWFFFSFNHKECSQFTGNAHTDCLHGFLVCLMMHQALGAEILLVQRHTDLHQWLLLCLCRQPRNALQVNCFWNG